jgi:hypothetical protein
MNSISKLLLSAVLPLAAMTAYAPAVNAQVVVYPTPAYVASYQPIYYNGYAHYYWNNHWVYRDRVGVWHGYATEPPVLWARRGEWVSRRYYWR